ncbi:MAG: hypothetical protein HC819_16995 [Cyclobacteriaceae bacterium]|nr:hypothetical protein [Cyclobacteriaceae bacterium]
MRYADSKSVEPPFLSVNGATRWPEPACQFCEFVSNLASYFQSIFKDTGIRKIDKYIR